MARKTPKPRSIDTSFLGVPKNHPRILEIALSDISPNPDQPRKHFDKTKLRELADSIESNGLAQPILVAQRDDGFIIVAGERRYRAHRMLEAETILAVVLHDRDESTADELALIENIQREDLTPLEEAEAYAALMERYGYNQAQLGKAVGKGRTVINRSLKLNTLPKEIKDDARSRPYISKSLLLELAKVEDRDEQATMWESMKSGTLTVKTARTTKAKLVERDVQRRTPPITVALRAADQLHAALSELSGSEKEEFPHEWSQLLTTLKLIRSRGVDLVSQI